MTACVCESSYCWNRELHALYKHMKDVSNSKNPQHKNINMLCCW